MLLDAAMHIKGIVFSRGGALATAPFPSTIVGHQQAAAAPTAAPGAQHREGQEERTGFYFNRVLPAKEFTIVYIDCKFPAK